MFKVHRIALVKYDVKRKDKTINIKRVQSKRIKTGQKVFHKDGFGLSFVLLINIQMVLTNRFPNHISFYYKNVVERVIFGVMVYRLSE